MIHALTRLLKRYPTFIRYCLIGSVSAGIDFSILIMSIEIIGFPLLAANTLSFSVAAFNSFYLNRRITFQNTYPDVFRQFVLFIACALIGVAINNAVLFLMARIIGIWYVFGKIIATGAALVWNYSINKRIIFAKQNDNDF